MPKRVIRAINRNPGIAGVLCAIVLIAPVYYLWYDDDKDSKREFCTLSVNSREDNRTMWQYLIEQFPDSPAIPEFKAELDLRLPELECVDSVPVEKEE